MKTKRPATSDPGHCPVRAAKMLAVFNALDDCMCNLAGRWADEKEYEDIADYRGVIQRRLEGIEDAAGIEITKMLKRPFGFECNFRGAKYRVTSGARGYGYNRIG